MSDYWIKLHSSVLENEIWQYDANAWRIFEYLCLQAYKGKPQGTVRTTRYKIENATMVNNSSVYRALKRLEANNMITTKRTSKYTLVTICKWATYQGKPEPVIEHQTNIKRTSNEHSYKNKDIRIKEKEIYKEKEKPGNGYKKALEVRNRLASKLSLG